MSQKPMVAIAALKADKFPDVKELFTRLFEIWPDHPEPDGVVHGVQAGQDVLSFNIGKDMFTVTRMPHEIPWSDLEGPCKAAWYYWPEAAETFQEHESHLLIVMTPGQDLLTDSAHALTRLLAAIAKSSETVGILWGGSGRVHQPESLVQACTETPPGILPVQIWVGFSPIQENDGTFSIYTDGMEAFELMEIEAQRTNVEPQHLYERVFDVAYFCIERNLAFKDGETFGMSETERILVSYGPSRAEPDNEVVILNF